MATSATDSLADHLSQVAVSGIVSPNEDVRERLKTILLDSFAVAIAALKHPAALAARRYASGFVSAEAPCALLGTSRRTNVETAALCNGVLLRCHDYNDLYIGQKSWGHPSDIVAALLAVAERRQSSGADFLEALAVGYEVTLALFDTVPAAAVGWDYSNLTAIAAVCASARLMRLSPRQTREALSIAVIAHIASDEIESGDLNLRGDLTMWKRFNGGDAMRQAVYACELAAAGAEGAVRPFEGRFGLLAKLGVSENPLPLLQPRLGGQLCLTHLDQVVLKRWPVGSRAQSAIQATLDARGKIKDAGSITTIRVRTTEPVFEHLVRSRPAPWAPTSRETADHSLPYIVAAAAFDGRIGTDSFSPAFVLDPSRRALLRKVEVTPDLPRSSTTDLGAFASTVEIRTSGGLVASAPERVAQHSQNAGSQRTLAEEKFHESCRGRIPEQNMDKALNELLSLESIPDIRTLTRHIAVIPDQSLDSNPEL